MLTSRFPFEKVSDIIKANYTNPENVSKGTTIMLRFLPCVECLDLLRRMLTVQKEERATLEQVLNHPWTLMSENELSATEIQVEIVPSKRRKLEPASDNA